MTAPTSAALVVAPLYVPEHDASHGWPYRLQDRTLLGGDEWVVTRGFGHARPDCAIRELSRIVELSPSGTYGPSRILVVLDPWGMVVAHTGTVADLLPEWRVA